MTPLKKRVTRRSDETLIRDGGKFRRPVVTLYPTGVIGIRLEKTRREETITIEAVYHLAVKLRVSSEQRDKPKRQRRMRSRRRS